LLQPWIELSARTSISSLSASRTPSQPHRSIATRERPPPADLRIVDRFDKGIAQAIERLPAFAHDRFANQLGVAVLGLQAASFEDSPDLR
jgi:hypothetical protein